MMGVEMSLIGLLYRGKGKVVSGNDHRPVRVLKESENVWRVVYSDEYKLYEEQAHRRNQSEQRISRRS
jgi:hypothetical protein